MKKMFLSLATIAFVATGVTSCGSDDSTTPVVEDPKLTENFIEVDGEQEEINYSIYAVHVDGSGENAPIREYTLDDGRVVIAFEFVAHNGTSAGALSSGSAATWVTLLTLVDESVPVGSEEGNRYVFPLTVEGTTILSGFTTNMNDTDYTYASGADFNVEDLVYGEGGSMTYTLEGVDVDASSIELKTYLDTAFTGALWSLPTNTGKGIESNLSAKKGGELSIRKSLN